MATWLSAEVKEFINTYKFVASHFALSSSQGIIFYINNYSPKTQVTKPIIYSCENTLLNGLLSCTGIML